MTSDVFQGEKRKHNIAPAVPFVCVCELSRWSQSSAEWAKWICPRDIKAGSEPNDRQQDLTCCMTRPCLHYDQ